MTPLLTDAAGRRPLQRSGGRSAQGEFHRLLYRRFAAATRHKFPKFGGIFCAAAPRLRKNELAGRRLQDSDHVLILFVGHRAENHPQAVRVELLQKSCERAHRRHIVGAVEEKPAGPLKAARPSGAVDAAHDVVFGNLKAFGRADRNGDILDLVAAGELRR